MSNAFKNNPLHDLVELSWNADDEGSSMLEFIPYKDRPDAPKDSAMKAAKWWSDQLKAAKVPIEGMSGPDDTGVVFLYATAPADPRGS